MEAVGTVAALRSLTAAIARDIDQPEENAMNAITRTLLTLVAATISLSFTRPLPRPRPVIACTARTVCGTCNVEFAPGNVGA